MKQNEKRTAKGVISIEEYLRKLKSNKNICPKHVEKEKKFCADAGRTLYVKLMLG